MTVLLIFIFSCSAAGIFAHNFLPFFFLVFVFHHKFIVNEVFQNNLSRLVGSLFFQARFKNVQCFLAGKFSCVYFL